MLDTRLISSTVTLTPMLFRLRMVEREMGVIKSGERAREEGRHSDVINGHNSTLRMRI
jgi:hypothetical protein